MPDAGLVYSTDARPGWSRRRCGRGFTYLNTRGELIRDERLRRRIKQLAIPPAWQDVWICSRPDGHIQRSEEHTSELQSRGHLVCRLLLEKKKKNAETRTVRY